MSIKIKRHLQTNYPELHEIFDKTKTIPKLQRRDLPLPEAVVRVVTGQMLSSQSAKAIYNRIRHKAAEQRLQGSWLLNQASLRECGLSRAKARTISEFGTQIGSDISALDHWYSLAAEDLVNKITQYRGMGEWTASILALFYVGHEDIFPSGDGSLRRAISIIQRTRSKKRRYFFEPGKAAPYRSYMALYLWNALDSKLLK